jgi:hypothetical protein
MRGSTSIARTTSIQKKGVETSITSFLKGREWRWWWLFTSVTGSGGGERKERLRKHERTTKYRKVKMSFSPPGLVPETFKEQRGFPFSFEQDRMITAIHLDSTERIPEVHAVRWYLSVSYHVHRGSYHLEESATWVQSPLSSGRKSPPLHS